MLWPASEIQVTAYPAQSVQHIASVRSHPRIGVYAPVHVAENVVVRKVEQRICNGFLQLVHGRTFKRRRRNDHDRVDRHWID